MIDNVCRHCQWRNHSCEIITEKHTYGTLPETTKNNPQHQCGVKKHAISLNRKCRPTNLLIYQSGQKLEWPAPSQVVFLWVLRQYNIFLAHEQICFVSRWILLRLQYRILHIVSLRRYFATLVAYHVQWRLDQCFTHTRGSNINELLGKFPHRLKSKLF